MSLPITSAPSYLTPDYLSSVGAADLAPPARPKRERFRFLSLAEAESIPKPTWLVDKVLPVGAGAELYGPPGAGKSFIAIDIAMSVASGRPFLGHVTKHSAVAYCLGESVGGVGARLRAWRHAHNATIDIRFRLLPGMVQLLDAGDVSAFLAAIHAQFDEPPGLIVIDTLARSIVGGEENSARDMGVAAASLDRVRDATGASALALHHTGKSGESERGSSSIRGAFETMLELKNDGGALTLRCEKQRDDEEFPPIAIQLTKFGESMIVERAGESLASRGPSKRALELLAILARDFAVGPPTASQWRDAMPSGGRTSFYRWQAELVRHHLVAIDESKAHARFAVTPAGHDALFGAGLSHVSHAVSHDFTPAQSTPDDGGSCPMVHGTAPSAWDTQTSHETRPASHVSHISHGDDGTEDQADLLAEIDERKAIQDEDSGVDER